MDSYLEHYGVKGMRWGVRKDATPGVSRKTDKAAKKDAQEFARAKMYYGDGAGTRRKLINKSVEAKRSKDPQYAKAFDNHLSKQDYSIHATKAQKERTSTDRKTRNKQRVGAVARRVTGERGTQAALVGLALGGAAFMRSPKAQAFVKKSYKSAEAVYKQKRGAAALNKIFKNMV